MINRYVKKPIPIEAVQWINNNEEELEEFVGKDNIEFVPSPYNSSIGFSLDTLEGIMSGKLGDYVVRGNHNDIWVVDRQIFEDTYERVE